MPLFTSTAMQGAFPQLYPSSLQHSLSFPPLKPVQLFLAEMAIWMASTGRHRLIGSFAYAIIALICLGIASSLFGKPFLDASSHFVRFSSRDKIVGGKPNANYFEASRISSIRRGIRFRMSIFLQAVISFVYLLANLYVFGAAVLYFGYGVSDYHACQAAT